MSTKFYALALLLLISLNASSQNALRFDGTDDYVESALSGPTGYNSRTVEAWVNISTQTSSQKVVLDWGDMATGSRFTLNVISGTPRIEVGNSGFSSSTSMAINTWHHVAATFDNAATPQLKLYLDGVLVNSGDFSVPVYTSAASGIIIGRRNDGINNFPGMIDEVRVWDIVRTQSEINANMNKEFCSQIPGLVAYYNFNQGVAGGINTSLTTLFDLSGNANNATLYNFGLAGANSNYVVGASLTGNSTSTISPSACQSYTTPSGLNTYTSSGMYHDTIPNASGCDSIITINLTLTSIDTSVAYLSGSLHANAPNSVYQWLDCNNNYAPIAGATFQNFVPAINGFYAVKITKFGCTDTSACHVITNVGVFELNSFVPFTIFPVPFQNNITISFDGTIHESEYLLNVFDLQGRVVYCCKQKTLTSQNIDTGMLDQGVYLIEINLDNSVYRQKIVKD
ncbi:MAG: T9SS type A sorting domain-containing protein [Bacteroidetes bacterium]|nr:T9SS type A sorting domain-containing protein [Bacteroidota bacterium]